MDSDPLPSVAAAAGDATADQTPPRRAVCHSGCGRPSSVCLCPYLPPSPLPTSTAVVILHHPHAVRRNPLSTLPLLARSLSNLRLIPGRRLLPSSAPLIARSPSSPVLLLFPSPDAADLASWCRSTPPAARANPTLLLLDGTWKQAKEMHAASLPFLSSFVVPVSLPVDCGVDGDSMFESELVVRKGPHKGCMSTMEAVARALRLLEPEGSGAEIEQAMVEVLQAMVAFQAKHVQHRPMKPRVKMRKKKDIKKEEGMNGMPDWCG
uniref:tRNA-uridine aminocarboxypropyltransferase n=1 Tax=Oryza brachyantha TaxID=4533 RepID=J3N5Y8_ORYBR